MTAATQHPVQLTAQLYATREAARTLLGARFAERMQEYGQVIRQVAQRSGKSNLSAAIAMGKEPSLSAGTVICILAAAVELEEPSA